VVIKEIIYMPQQADKALIVARLCHLQKRKDLKKGMSKTKGNF